MVSRSDDEAEPRSAAPPATAEQASTDAAARSGRLRAIVAENLPTLWRFLRRLGLAEADADDLLCHMHCRSGK